MRASRHVKSDMPPVRWISVEYCVSETINSHHDAPRRILVVGRLRCRHLLPVSRPADEAWPVRQVLGITLQKHGEAAPLAAERAELCPFDICAEGGEWLLVRREKEVVTEERRDALGLVELRVIFAFVLHDVSGMTFDEIASIVDRSAVAARQLASRARRRVQGRATSAERDLRQQRRVVDAFMAAAQEGDFERLVAVLDPDIVLRADAGTLTGMSRVVRGARAVAAQAATFARSGLSNQLVLVNGHLGFVTRRPDGRLFSVTAFTIAGGRVVEMDILADPERLSRLDLSAIEG